MTSPSADSQSSTFQALGLRPELLDALAALGYEEPTPIQSAAVPPLIAGRDLLGQAATGTGKTAAFALPMLQTLEPSGDRKLPVGLVLVPTRELALQVSQALHSYGRRQGVRLVAVYGGAPVRQQIDALRRGVDIVVATPGRALDLTNRGSLNLSGIQTVVLDEADEMLDMGFVEDIETLLALTPASRQTVLFSATLPKRIDKLAARHLRDPERISIAPPRQAKEEAPRVRQAAYIVTRPNKAAALGRILDAEDPSAAIVFCRTRGGVDELTDLLTSRGYQAEALHGGLTQDQRDRVMGRLRAGTTDLLVATDVAARGLDVEHLTHVFNYDLPASPEAYVHRVGRVGRAGREGVAVSLVEPRERRMLAAIEKLMKVQIPIEQVPSVADVRILRWERSRTAISDLLADEDAVERLAPAREVLSGLLDEHDPVDVAAAAFALAHEATQGAAGAGDDVDLSVPARDREQGKGDKGKPAKKRDRLSGPTERVFVSLGRKAGITPSDLVGAITGETGLKGRDIGAVTIHEHFSLVEVPADKARKVVKDLQHCAIRGRKAKVRLDRGA